MGRTKNKTREKSKYPVTPLRAIVRKVPVEDRTVPKTECWAEIKWAHVKEIFSQYLESENAQIIFRFDPCHLFTDKQILAVITEYLYRLNKTEKLNRSFLTTSRFLSLLFLAIEYFDEGTNGVSKVMIEQIAERKFKIGRKHLHRAKSEIWRSLDFRLDVSPEKIDKILDQMGTNKAFNRERAVHHSGVKRLEDDQRAFDFWIDNPQKRCADCKRKQQTVNAHDLFNNSDIYEARSKDQFGSTKNMCVWNSSD